MNRRRFYREIEPYNTVKAWECDFKGAKDLVHKAYKSGAYIYKTPELP